MSDAANVTGPVPEHPAHEIPEREFSERELRSYLGERGMPMYVAYAGVVYDVTHCPKWRRGIHENLHWPGQDLTSELPDAPHDADVFNHPCVRRVGRLRAIPSIPTEPHPNPPQLGEGTVNS